MKKKILRKKNKLQCRIDLTAYVTGLSTQIHFRIKYSNILSKCGSLKLVAKAKG